MEDYFNCGICEEIFDGELRKPILPTCGHMICLDCLTQIMKKARLQ